MAMITRMTLLAAALAATVGAGPAFGKASQADIDRLGKDLTPVGAEKAGNKDGTIPAWDGGLKAPPAGYDRSKGFYIDPYASDKPLFTITAANAAQYKDKLSAGQLAMLEKYPSYKLNVYPTHRSAAYPQRVYDEVKKQAGLVDLADGGNGVLNTGKSYVPFPVPKSGVEVIWNHSMRYRGTGAVRAMGQYVVNTNGTISPRIVEIHFMHANEMPDAEPNRNFYYRQAVLGPASVEGQNLLVHEPLDQVKEARLAWQYNPGQRRVLRAPEVAYDRPGTGTDGLSTDDMTDAYNGSPDRYDWKLVGKRELFIPYNNYKAYVEGAKYEDLLKTPLHPNPDLVRWELHRVWVVEGTLKADKRHIYAKRVFYVDEDSWSIAAADLYDGRGELWRTQYPLIAQFYEAPASWDVGQVTVDLQSRRYIILQLLRKPITFGEKMTLRDFGPSELRRVGTK
jgi:hypothetical protein